MNRMSDTTGKPLSSESAGEAECTLMGYLEALDAFDAELPGLARAIHGVEIVDGIRPILCITED